MTGSIEQLKEKYDLKVRWRAFPLHPDTPLEGRTLEDLFSKKGIEVDVEKMMARLKKTAADMGYVIGDRKMTYNSRLAQEVGLWAVSEGKGDEFHMRAFKAYFVEGLNLARKEVLMDLIQSSGLDPDEGKRVMKDRRFSTAVDEDWALARNIGITAVPTFTMGMDRLVGAKPYTTIERMVLKYIS